MSALEIGGHRILDLELVVKLGVICRVEESGERHRLWNDRETEAYQRIPGFHPILFFYGEEYIKGELHFSFRYYTPFSNRYFLPKTTLQDDLDCDQWSLPVDLGFFVQRPFVIVTAGEDLEEGDPVFIDPLSGKAHKAKSKPVPEKQDDVFFGMEMKTYKAKIPPPDDVL